MARDESESGRTPEHRNVDDRRTQGAMSARHGSQLFSRSTMTAAALIGVTALVEPELLMGMAIGAGLAVASNWLPDVFGGVVRPMVKTAIKAGYTAASAAREMMSEATEGVQDIVAEARSERGPQ
jgi:Protein of unknown function (DUF5132)